MSTTYTIICAIVGDNIEFPIKIESSEIVGTLKIMIKEMKPNRFVTVDAGQLTLYRVDISGSREARKKELEEMDDLDQREDLDPLSELITLYPIAPPKQRIHILVRPLPQPSRKRKLSPSMTVSDLVTVSRRKIFTSESVAPSSFGKPMVYDKLDNKKYAFNRPPSPETIPLALLHKIFGQFVENARTRVPTAADNTLVRELRQVMSVVYETEAMLCHEFRSTVENHYEEIQFEAAAIGSTNHQSDGHVRYKGFHYSVVEGNLLGKRTGDPEVQACGYFISSIKAGNKDRVQLETLTPTFSLHANAHESEIALQAARAFGAFRIACEDLRAHYENLAPKISATNRPDARRLLFPYEDHYTAGDEERVKFDYLERLHPTKLIFTAKNSKGDTLFIKFTRRYSTDAHKYCSDRGIAPKLYAVEELPGGWKMIVMEFLGDEAYIPPSLSKVGTIILRDSIKATVDILHQGGFVHGDIRDANVMVKSKWDTSGVENVMLADFDWAGQVNKAKYPPNVNFLEINRPIGARDGESITKEHDLEMLGNIFPNASVDS